MSRRGFYAVVESGSCSQDYKRWEERQNCGHAHKSPAAAEACGKKHYTAKYVNGSWQACAAWHGYTVHDEIGQRVSEPPRE